MSDLVLLSTSRLTLDPITIEHAEPLHELLGDRELYHFMPFKELSFEERKNLCERWSIGRSPNGDEIWLNWIAKETNSGQAIGHFQAGISAERIATIAYVVATKFQRQGFALEALTVILIHLREVMQVREVKAWSDTRNIASHSLADKLGLRKIETIKDADFFNGATSNEYVFSLKFT
jgi:RimJ/RimL family protein N-acetyltransferase